MSQELIFLSTISPDSLYPPKWLPDEVLPALVGVRVPFSDEIRTDEDGKQWATVTAKDILDSAQVKSRTHTPNLVANAALWGVLYTIERTNPAIEALELDILLGAAAKILHHENNQHQTTGQTA